MQQHLEKKSSRYIWCRPIQQANIPNIRPVCIKLWKDLNHKTFLTEVNVLCRGHNKVSIKGEIVERVGCAEKQLNKEVTSRAKCVPFRSDPLSCKVDHPLLSSHLLY